MTASPLTAARITRLAREGVHGSALFTTKPTGTDRFLTRVRLDTVTAEAIGRGTTELRLLNLAREHFTALGYEATVISTGGTRGAAVRYGVLVIDTPTYEARLVANAEAREEALRKALAESPAATPAELAYDGGRTAQAAAELSAPAERITCGLCGEPLVRETPADSGSFWRHEDPTLDGHPKDHPGEDLGTVVAATVEAVGGTVTFAEVLPYELEPAGEGRWFVADRQSEALWGAVRRVEESMRPGSVQWTRFVAYRADGSRVGYTDSLPGAARLLVPLSAQAQETLAARRG